MASALILWRLMRYRKQRLQRVTRQGKRMYLKKEQRNAAYLSPLYELMPTQDWPQTQPLWTTAPHIYLSSPPSTLQSVYASLRKHAQQLFTLATLTSALVQGRKATIDIWLQKHVPATRQIEVNFQLINCIFFLLSSDYYYAIRPCVWWDRK